MTLKPITSSLISLFALLTLVVSCTGQDADIKSYRADQKGKSMAVQKVQKETSESYRAGEVLVSFKKYTSKKTIEAILINNHLRIIYKLGSPNRFLTKINDNTSVEDKINLLQSVPELSYAEPNYIIQIQPLKEYNGTQKNEILIRFEKNVKVHRIETLLKELNLKINHTYTLPSLFLVSITDKKTVKEKLKSLHELPEVLYAEPNNTIQLTE